MGSTQFRPDSDPIREVNRATRDATVVDISDSYADIISST